MPCQRHKRRKTSRKHAEMRKGPEDFFWKHKFFCASESGSQKILWPTLPHGVTVARKALDFVVHVRIVVGQPIDKE